MIKKFNIFLFVLTGVSLTFIVGCASGVTLSALSKAEIQPAVAVNIESSHTLPEYEKLVFEVKWLGIIAGEIVAEIKGRVIWQDRPCYLIEVTARTRGFVSSIYNVDDLYRSYLDAEKYFTLRYEERRQEGSYRKDAVTDFDHAKGKAYFSNAVDGSKKVYDIPYGVQDSVTAAYAARLLPLDVGKVFEFKVCNSEKVYDLYAAITGRQKIVHDRKIMDTLHLVPFAKINGSEVREGRVSGFLTDDARKVPLRVVIKAPVFTQVTATLKP